VTCINNERHYGPFPLELTVEDNLHRLNLTFDPRGENCISIKAVIWFMADKCDWTFRCSDLSVRTDGTGSTEQHQVKPTGQARYVNHQVIVPDWKHYGPMPVDIMVQDKDKMFRVVVKSYYDSSMNIFATFEYCGEYDWRIIHTKIHKNPWGVRDLLCHLPMGSTDDYYSDEDEDESSYEEDPEDVIICGKQKMHTAPKQAK
jgi:hypothetical protein